MLYPTWDPTYMVVSQSSFGSFDTSNNMTEIKENGYLITFVQAISGGVGVWIVSKNGKANLICYAKNIDINSHEKDANVVPVKKGDKVYVWASAHYLPGQQNQNNAQVAFCPFRR